MRYAQIVVGPAGSGKTTYCKALQEYLLACKRPCHIINLDPATEEGIDFRKGNSNKKSNLKEEYSAFDTDIRDFVDIGEVVAEDELGPNAALVKSAELLTENIDWLATQIEETYADEAYLLLDTPGQIELFVHLDYVKSISQLLQRLNINTVTVFLLDVSFMTDPSKLIAGSMAGLAAMINLQAPHLNILTKCDLIYDNDSDGNMTFKPFLDITSSTFGMSAKDLQYQRRFLKNKKHTESLDEFDEVLEPREFNYNSLFAMINQGPDQLVESLHSQLPSRFKRLNAAFVSLLEEFNLVSFLPLNIYDEDSLEQIIVATDMAIQHGEEAEPRTNFDLMDTGE
ncbi:bifunctional P-loop containing nucleoside triphosphate hydrolase/GPN-loop GTPase 3/GPN-loop GTPase [Babesia duncani]|uniref:GPN-loop GTPase 3 n=1 Tax=Babesia duncani TaxID=323732 RepID=A0AAD9PI30_9APIC|nr:bifunctional P-loop containing nucleoside triphosphate hydrolase/GPN-loop GTPase 3/GPN-loop GTPase [Babesia duncani]